MTPCKIAQPPLSDRPHLPTAPAFPATGLPDKLHRPIRWSTRTVGSFPVGRGRTETQIYFLMNFDYLQIWRTMSHPAPRYTWYCSSQVGSNLLLVDSCPSRGTRWPAILAQPQRSPVLSSGRYWYNWLAGNHFQARK